MESHWLQNDIEIITPNLVLQLGTDEEIISLAERAYGKVLKPGQEHFFETEWWNVPRDEFIDNFIKHSYSHKENWDANNWTFFSLIFERKTGEAIGQMSLRGNKFSDCRELSTGSWLIEGYRGRGYGREARAGFLFFGFKFLEALLFKTAAMKDNIPSNKVTKSLNYKRDEASNARENTGLVHYILDRKNWLDDTEVVVKGDSEECLSLFRE